MSNTITLIHFRVTTSLAGQPPEQINILARSSCEAANQAVRLLFLDAGDCITAGFKIKVEPIRPAVSRLVDTTPMRAA